MPRRFLRQRSVIMQVYVLAPGSRRNCRAQDRHATWRDVATVAPRAPRFSSTRLLAAALQHARQEVLVKGLGHPALGAPTPATVFHRQRVEPAALAAAQRMFCHGG